MHSPFHLEGKTILVTGASSGIGRSVAVECSKMGASVVISGRSQERLEETMGLLEGTGHVSIPADLSNCDDIGNLAAQCPQIDGLSHNAGITDIIPVKHISAEKLGSVMNTNALGPILLTQQLVRKKKIKKNGSIVFTSSLSGIYCSSYGESMYAASKGAINAFAKVAALELAAQNIRVNCVNPSIIKTDIFNRDGGKFTEEQMEERIPNYPLKRLGMPSDVSMAHVFLLSSASSWITGVDIPIDGGYILI